MVVSGLVDASSPGLGSWPVLVAMESEPLLLASWVRDCCCNMRAMAVMADGLSDLGNLLAELEFCSD